MNTYSSYKGSGVEWIGEIPSGWDTIKCGYLFRVVSLKNNIGEQNLSVYRDYGVIQRDSRDDNHNRVSEDISNYKLVDVGNFVFNKMKCWMGSLGVSKFRGIVSPSYTVCETTQPFDGKYLHHLLRSKLYIQEFESLSYGVRVGQWELRFHDFRDILSVFPPLQEQQQISNYLDHKTQQIESLIEKTQQKIELLKEQRISLINQVVTKGLNPDVEMKNSGVEWIGEIPSGWDTIRIKYITSDHRQGYYSSSPYDDNGYRVVRITDINDNHSINIDNSPSYNLEQLDYERFKLEKGDFLFPRTGGVGRFGVFDSSIESIYGSFLIRFRFNHLIKGGLLKYLFESDIYLGQIKSEIHGGVNQNVHVENIKECYIPITSPTEQQQIVDYLDKETTKIDSTIEKETQRIDLLKEYRQSLISEVVTGKVDIRDEVLV